jgi:hypothetical protein
VATDPIFEPLRFRNLTVKNRLFRSSISGRFDNYDGAETQARITWEEKFGCYDVRRFNGDHDAMVIEIMTVDAPAEFEEAMTTHV